MLAARDEGGSVVFPPGGTRVLAYPAAHHAIADGGAAGKAAGGDGDYAFVYLNLRMNRGRTATTQQAVGKAVEAVVLQHFAELQHRQSRWIEEQRRFLADATHQLRTPMAVLRTQLQAAMAGDMLVAAKNAQFSVAYVKVGLTPDGGATALLSEFVSRQVLTELCLTGERVSGERMHQLGVVNRLVEPGQALAAALALAQQVAAGPELATARIKHLCRVAPRNTLEQQLELEALYMPLSQETEESREGINAFLEKRAPDFAKLRSSKPG